MRFLRHHGIKRISNRIHNEERRLQLETNRRSWGDNIKRHPKYS